MKLLSNNHVAALLGLGIKPEPKTKNDANCFGFLVGEEELVVEIVNVELPDRSVGFRGNIEIEAYEPDGTNVQLAPLDYDRAINEAGDYMDRKQEESERDSR